MKKRGFTLIELLAVIVVLAIIALIATPIVMNVIKNASAGAAERSADNYVKAVETLIATEKLDGTPVADGEYTIGSTGKLTKDGNSYEVEVSGTKPVGGKVVIKDGQVVKNGSTINYTDHTVTFKEGKAEATEKGDAVVLCTATTPVAQPLFNMETEEVVDTVVGVQATESAPYAVGATYKCNLGDGDRIFYVLKEEEGNKVSLLMEENIGTTIMWCSNVDDDNSCNGDGARAYLKLQTKDWNKLFEENGMVKLPTADEMTVVADQDWARGNLDMFNVPQGYWTSTAYTGDSVGVQVMFYDGTVFNIPASLSEASGVRPLITISKDNMSL